LNVTLDSVVLLKHSFSSRVKRRNTFMWMFILLMICVL